MGRGKRCDANNDNIGIQQTQLIINLSIIALVTHILNNMSNCYLARKAAKVRSYEESSYKMHKADMVFHGIDMALQH